MSSIPPAISGYKSTSLPRIQNGKRLFSLHSQNSLSHLVRTNQKAALEKVLKEGNCSPNTQDIHGCTPLFLAVEKNHLDLATLLLEHAANPNIKTTLDESPLSQAIADRSPEMAGLLLAYRANPGDLEPNVQRTLFQMLQHQALLPDLIHLANAKRGYDKLRTFLQTSLETDIAADLKNLQYNWQDSLEAGTPRVSVKEHAVQFARKIATALMVPLPGPPPPS